MLAAFFAVGFTVFGGVLTHEYVSWDDFLLIVNNPIVHTLSPKTLMAAFTTFDPELYVPLTMLSYQLEFLFGGSSSLVHATNLVLHIGNAFLVASLLSRLLSDRRLGILLGLLFLVHPLNVESAAWASARKDVLSTFFFLLSIQAYLLWKEWPSRRSFWISVGCFLLGLLSKVMILTLPIVLLLIDFMRGERSWRRSIIEKWPYWLLSLIFGVVAVFGKTIVLEQTTPFQKFLMAGRSTTFYLQKFFLPVDLSVAYPFNGVITLSSPTFFVPIMILLGLLISLAFLWKSKPLVVLGVAFFLATLVPTFINFSKGGDVYFASDRYAYVPMIGLLLALGSIVREIASHRRERIVLASAVTVLVLLAALSWRQTRVWAESSSLYEHALALYPDARAIRNNLGMVRLADGLYAQALVEFDTSLAVRDDPRVRANRASVLAKLDRFAEARQEYERVLLRDATNEEAHYGLGFIAHQERAFDEAIRHYEDALAIDPEHVNSINNLAAVHILQRNWSAAVAMLLKQAELEPGLPEVFFNLAGAYQELGQIDHAIRAYERVIELRQTDPDAHAFLASALYAQGSIDSAAEHLQAALTYDSSNVFAHALLMRMRQDGVAE